MRSGPSTASDDRFDIVIEGVGGHAAHPEEAVDPIPIAAQLVMAVQQLMTREVNPVTPAVFTFGSIHGGTRRNVIPATVELSGTLRTVHRANRERLVARIGQVARAVAEAHRATVKVRHIPGYDVGVNDPALSELVASAARAVLGEHRVIAERYPTMGGEDFYAFGSTGLPVSMFLLGTANPERGIIASNHSPDFDIDEDALPAGVAVFAESIRRLLTA
jgi:amidohydrolase